MRMYVAAIVVSLLAMPLYADVFTYGWEDGQTILGSYGTNLVDPTNVTGPQSGLDGSGGGMYGPSGASEGSYYLHVAEEPHDGTPQVYVAYIEGLEDGDMVTASFDGYDVTPGGGPSLRIWGHYAVSGDVNSYAGSASGNGAYTAGTGWDNTAWTWTFDSSLGTRDALVVEVRLYSDLATDPLARTDYWIDNLVVDITSGDGVYTVNTPGYSIEVPEPTSLVLMGLAGLFLRRRR